jgi:thioredoxin-like negative regulator of GroEL
MIDDAAEQFAGKVKIGTINTRKEGDIAFRYHIDYTPKVFLFQRGAEPRQIPVNLADKQATLESFSRAVELASP